MPGIGYVILLVVAALVVAAILLLKPVKEEKPQAGTVQAFLSAAFELYVEAYARKKPELLHGYFSVPCLMATANKIMYHNVKNFATEAHRNLKWTCCGDLDKDGAIIWRVDITFKQIGRTRGAAHYLLYGDPMREHWKVLEMEPQVYRIILVCEEDPYDIKNSES